MRALAGYAVLLLGVVVGLFLLSLLVDDRTGVGRIVWLGAGLLLGSLWAVRSRLPVLRSALTPVAVGGWLGLIAAAVLTLAATAPSFPSAATTEAGAGRPALARPAPPTAVRRTGTVAPTPRSTAVRPAASPAAEQPAPHATVDVTATAIDEAGASPDELTPSPPPIPSPSPQPRRSPTVARAEPTPTPALPAGFDPERYLGQGNAYSCTDFGSQAEAQAVLRADPSDPNQLDLRRDGLACGNNPPPRDTRRVPRPAP